MYLIEFYVFGVISCILLNLLVILVLVSNKAGLMDFSFKYDLEGASPAPLTYVDDGEQTRFL